MTAVKKWRWQQLWWLVMCMFVFVMMGRTWLRSVFSSEGFMPHASCYMNNMMLIGLHVVSDLVIGLSYVAISSTLVYLVFKSRRLIPFHVMFLAFGAFIITCGCTHFMEVVTVWTPLYWLAGMVKVVCALASIVTAIWLFPLIPKIFALIEDARLGHERTEELESFSYSVSHDLRAPLRGIKGIAAMMREDCWGKMGPECQAHLDMIDQGAAYMDTLINDLLNYSVISRQPSPLVTLSVTQVLIGVQDMMAPEILASKAKITGDKMPVVLGNARLLTQVLANLLGNSIKFVAEGVIPEIHISAQEKYDVWRICVDDNGIGINPKYRHKVFRIFERLCDPRKYQGTGIGLAIVAKAMQRMRGTVDFETAPSGHGTRFWIELPKAPRR